MYIRAGLLSYTNNYNIYCLWILVLSNISDLFNVESELLFFICELSTFLSNPEKPPYSESKESLLEIYKFLFSSYYYFLPTKNVYHFLPQNRLRFSEIFF
jgi:hypothetical protein